MFNTVGTAAAGFLLRAFEVLAGSSLYLLIGFLTAGAIRSMAAPETVRRLFGAGHWSAPLRAWAAATVLLPVCALGVLPVLRELRRAGVARPAVLTFALAAPALNPVSLAFGASYLGPRLLALLTLGTFLVSAGVGLLWVALRPGDLRADVEGASGGATVPAVGLRRLTAAVVAAAREATGESALHIGAGVLGAAVVAALVPSASLAAGVFAGDPLAIPRMLAVAPLAYLTPDQAVVALPEMLKFRQSAGAMFVLLVLGAGMTLGHLTWIGRSYGARAAALWFALTFGLTLAGAYAVDSLVTPVGTANADNDHLARLANPIEADAGFAAFPRDLNRGLREAAVFRFVTCGALLALVAAGLAFRARGERGTFEAFLRPLPGGDAPRAASRWDRPLPARLVGALGAAAATAVVTAGVYAYFPSPAEAFRDMQIIKADYYGELSQDAPAAALHHLDLWDRQASLLPTGARLRFAAPGAEALRLTRELRDGIGRLREATRASRRDDAREEFVRLQGVYERCKRGYRLGG